MTHAVERCASWCKRVILPPLGRRSSRWLRRGFELALELLTLGRGVPRRMNQMETVRVSPGHRYVSEDYEPEVFAYLRALIRPGQTIIDVGAHIGIYSIILARWVGPSGRVFAFEPAPSTAELLRRHLRINGVANRVVVVEAALGERSGETTLRASGDHIQNTLSPFAAGLGHGYEETTVGILSLDEFCSLHGLRPDWVKIDTEGWELPVLRGAAGLLKSAHPPRFVVEMHPYAWAGAGHDRAGLEAFLNEHALRATPLSGQKDALSVYGQVLLERE